VIYTSEERFIPSEFETLVYYIELAPPDRDELFEILKTYLENQKYYRKICNSL
jgi:hypothetical protein